MPNIAALILFAHSDIDAHIQSESKPEGRTAAAAGTVNGTAASEIPGIYNRPGKSVSSMDVWLVGQ